jgi:ubiquinone/menaquinone biosynthesis C-methylase UbiE
VLPARVDRDRVPAIYGRLASIYDVFARLVETRARDYAIGRAQIQDGEDILEVAVGTGLAFDILLGQNPGGTTTGVDVTPQMLQRARNRISGRRRSGWRLLEADPTSLPFPDGSFDLVYSAYMFDLLPERDFAIVLSEFKRVLRYGGRIVIVNMAIPRRFWHALWQLLYRLHPPLMGGCRGVELRRYLEHVHFDDIETHYISQLTFPSEIVTAVMPQGGRQTNRSSGGLESPRR